MRDIERAFADVDRARFGWWLRSNGRYLIPGGMRDTLFASALYLRNLLGTHIEIAIAASLIGMVLAAINLLLWDTVFRAVDLNSLASEAAAGVTDLASVQSVRLLVQWATQWPTLWFTLVGPFVASVVLACAYWSVRDRPSTRRCCCRWRCGGAGRRRLLDRADAGAALQRALWLAPAFVVFALCWVVALLWVLWRSTTARRRRSCATS